MHDLIRDFWRMKLGLVTKENIKAGEVLVYRGKSAEQHDAGGYFYKLAIVVSSGAQETVLSPFTALWDDDDEDEAVGSAPQRVPKSVPTAEFGNWLARPVWEVGDALFHRGRSALVTETKANDLHVSIKYMDEAGGNFYGNLIWMDSSPTLNLLRRNASWPPLP